MGDQGPAGEDRNIRRRLHPDGRDVPQHQHQKLESNTNRTPKEIGLEDLIKKLEGCRLVNQKEVKVGDKYEHLPGWAHRETPEVQANYRGMRTVMRSVHLNRLSCLNNILDGHEARNTMIKKILKASMGDLEDLQKKIEELGGRKWKLPEAFSLPLALLDE